MAVNVSSLQFRQADFVTRVKQALVDSAADPAWLTLEMTESILLQDVDGTIEKIQILKRLGVRFSIDDFGTGYSSSPTSSACQWMRSRSTAHSCATS